MRNLLSAAMVFLLCGCTDNHFTDFGDDFRAFIQNAWNEMQAAPASFPSSGPTCVFNRAVTSGSNKICYYNCGGTIAETDQAATTICPLRFKPEGRVSPDMNSGFKGHYRYAAVTGIGGRAGYSRAE